MISIEGLSFSWPDGTKAIDHISLTVAEGESVGIVGIKRPAVSEMWIGL